MHKKGQLTFFLLGGIVLVLIVFLSTGFQEQQARVEQAKVIQDDPTTALNNFVQTCLDQTAANSIQKVAMQGGYETAPVASSSVLNFRIPHYWSLHQAVVPEMSRIEREIEASIKNSLPACLNSLEVFAEQGFVVTQPSPSVGASIAQDTVFVSLTYPATIAKGASTFSLSEFSSEVDVPLNKAYGVAKKIIEEQEKNPDVIPLSPLAVLAKENDFTFEIINHNSNEVILSLIFKTKGSDFVYSFVNVYNWGEDES